jgi:hypothetical protein
MKDVVTSGLDKYVDVSLASKLVFKSAFLLTLAAGEYQKINSFSMEIKMYQTFYLSTIYQKSWTLRLIIIIIITARYSPLLDYGPPLH